MTKGAVQNIVEKLHKARWLHVSGYVREQGEKNVKFVAKLKAGKGRDAKCNLVPLTQAERDTIRYAKHLKRKRRLAAWALPLTVVVSKPRPAKSFPESVEREQI